MEDDWGRCKFCRTVNQMFLFGQVKFEGSGALESGQSLIDKFRNFRLRMVFHSLGGSVMPLLKYSS